ncbi:MAG: UDP-N-acetylglucosamine 4-epimerase [Alphaproteobacteria bacterium MarineAlpha5_Bin12]|nr:MAG: UDP-N-acetylglucosamine 4-epimerase [Alphaproteobacteria bacterium MarineAlpha5_Bin12]|tara:strand:- start:3848 stop:4816 length:969 start_codon:yes stop_codon:yes gene_type:complete
MKVLITGCCGFIGYNLCLKLLKKKNIRIYGIDNLNSYYDINLKKKRLSILKTSKNFTFNKIDISKYNNLKKFFKKNKYDIVINLAAQAGVRYSIKNPSNYFESNVIGFFNVLELSRIFKIKHFIFASTSSVYGNSNKFPLKEEQKTEKPLSFYAASKKTNEILAYSYSNIYKLPCTGLRFFTVYGPYGRPDMALYLFTKAIFNSKKVNLFNNGNHVRDYTYIDDVVNSVEKIITKKPDGAVPYSIYNVASSRPKKLKEFLKNIEKTIGKRAKINYLDMQQGDVYKTHGSTNKLINKIKYRPKMKLSEGIKRFVEWYKKYHNI